MTYSASRRINGRANDVVSARRALDKKYGEEPPEPFPGWHSRGYLPHCDKPGLIQLVTFRLADAMPVSRRHEWEPLTKIPDERERQTRVEAYLDRGHGACDLKRTDIAGLVEHALLFHDAERYRLCAWVVMPNHVHALFEVWKTPMKNVLYSWKRLSAVGANKLLGHRGRWWQKEYWDRFLRDEEHFDRARRYIETNPVKAGLCARAEDWPWSSANPKWLWNLGQDERDGQRQTMTRYGGGHLVSENWRAFLDRAKL